NHSTFKSQENISTFICPICGCNQDSIPADFFKHIFGHLKNSETLTCVFRNCEYKTNVYERYRTHKYRKHSSNACDFKPGIVQIDENTEEFDGKLSDVESDIDCQEDLNVLSKSDYSQHLEKCLECKLAAVLLKLESIFLISNTAKGNLAYHAYNKALTLNTKPKSDILNVLTEDIYKYTPYPTDAHFSEVAKALIEKHPCLKEPGSFNGAYGWKQRLKYKMGNYRTQLKVLGCPELSINAKSKDDKSAARKMKRARRAEANFYPTLPLGETSDTLERERLDILMEMQKRSDDQVVRDKMARTFAYRRQEVVDQQPRIEDFKTRWPALFSEREVMTIIST
uniref:C2H2-type domain-containing protein n=1 Tax=Amphiprion ocellaris TaxID=80972 RepID=A0AAQ5Y9B3_AMPOC